MIKEFEQKFHPEYWDSQIFAILRSFMPYREAYQLYLDNWKIFI